jgi:hypothetical protein
MRDKSQNYMLVDLDTAKVTSAKNRDRLGANVRPVMLPPVTGKPVRDLTRKDLIDYAVATRERALASAAYGLLDAHLTPHDQTLLRLIATEAKERLDAGGLSAAKTKALNKVIEAVEAWGRWQRLVYRELVRQSATLRGAASLRDAYAPVRFDTTAVMEALPAQTVLEVAGIFQTAIS